MTGENLEERSLLFAASQNGAMSTTAVQANPLTLIK
jgi:hypothetical protein